MSEVDRYAPWDPVIKEYFSWDGMWRALFKFFDPKFREVALRKLNAYYEHPERYANFADGILFLTDILTKGAVLPDSLKTFVKLTAGGAELLLDILPQGQIAQSSIRGLVALGLGDLQGAIEALGQGIASAKKGQVANATLIIQDLINSFVKHHSVNVNVTTYTNGKSRIVIHPNPPSHDLAAEEFEKLRIRATTLTPEQLARLEAFYEDQKNGHYEEIPGKHVGGGVYTQPTFIWVRDFNADGTPVSKNEVGGENIGTHTKTMKYAYTSLRTTAEYRKWLSVLQSLASKEASADEIRSETGLTESQLKADALKVAEKANLDNVITNIKQGSYSSEQLLYIYLTLTPTSVPSAPPAPPTASPITPSPMENHNGIADAMTHTNLIDEKINSLTKDQYEDSLFENKAIVKPEKEIANFIQTGERELLYEQLYNKPYDFGPVPFVAESEPKQKVRIVNLPFKAPRRR